MARTLDQILTELSPQYDPQIQNIQRRQAEIPGQIAAEEQGLQARQTQAFDDITSGARRRGIGFSGIPLAEQAKYTSTEFLPAMARLRQTGREQAMSLEDAILGINERRGNLGQQIRQQELDRDEQQRQFDQQLAAQERARRSAAATAASFRPSFGAPSPTQGAPAVGNQALKSKAMNDVAQMLGRRGTNSFVEEVIAISKSAGYGNTYDQAKLELLRASQPGLFNPDGSLSQRAFNLTNPNYSKGNQLPRF